MSNLLPLTLPTAGQFLRWGFNNAALFALWADSYQPLMQATSYNGRWLVVRPLGDATAPALDELFNQAATRGNPETEAELRSLEDELLTKINAWQDANRGLIPRAPRDRKWLKAALAALKIGLPMLVPEAGQWVGLLDLLGN